MIEKKYEIRALTGIRGIAATWVVGFHFYTTIALLFPCIDWFLITVFKPGFLGVDLFFILSGFIIAYNYQDKLHPFRFGAFGEFLYARLARIYPVHLATLFACLALVVGAKITNMHLNSEATNWGVWSFFANIALVQAWTSTLHENWNFPSWSISCEWLAYLCFPVLAAISALRWGRWKLWVSVSLLLGGYLYLNMVKSALLHWAFSRILFEFPVGVCLYQLSVLRKASGKGFRFAAPEISALAICAMMVVCSICNVSNVLIIPFLALLLYSLANIDRGPLRQLLASRVACYWGRVSYSLYMTHAVTSMVMVKLLSLATFEGRSLFVRIGVCVVYFGAISLVAMLVYHLIEEPARRRMRRFAAA